ncbi:MAG: amidohydrolase [Ilumatobacteraceae bacterium]|nr:amidohydrolase [Ilumatobacteraceae bacterium]
MTERLAFPVFDADNHLYETRDAFTRHLPDEYRGAIDYVEVHGRTKIVVRGQISNYIPNPTFDRIGVPGVQEEYFRTGNPEGKSAREIIGRGIDCPDAYRSAEPRLKHLDEQGLDYTLIIPTLASLVEERMRDAPDMCAAVVHSLNQWIAEEWPFTYEGRLFSTPIISPGLLDKAIEELEWVLDQGARAILMRPAPAWGYQGPRSFALPEFDPFWARVQEAGILTLIHASDSGYSRYVNEWSGTKNEMQAFAEADPFIHAMQVAHREIQDAVTSLICHGTLARFPDLKFALVENGAGWLPGLLKMLDHTWGDMPQKFAEKPSDTFKRNFWMHPFHEEDPQGLIDLIGSDHVIFGSDYPHVEGLANPLSYRDELAGIADDDVAKIMGGNMMKLMGVAA